MNKLLTGVCASALFFNVANACDAASFTGAFVGAGFVMSFDKDEYEMDYGASSDAPAWKGAGSLGTAADAKAKREGDGDITYPRQKKNKAAFGGQVVFGYGHQFENNMYVAIMHESLFSSKAEADYVRGNIDVSGDVEGVGFSVRQSRQCWTPSVGVALGYVVDQWNFGLRGGFSFEKVKFHHENVPVNNAVSVSGPGEIVEKKITMNSPYIGAYVEYKLNSVVMYANVDYCFGKKKTFEHAWGYTATVDSPAFDLSVGNKLYGNAETQHKRSSWKVALGVKANINNLVSMAS